MKNKEKQIEIEKILRECVIKLDSLSDNNPFKEVDLKALLYCMDNAVFFMNAEIKDVSDSPILGKWQLVPFKLWKTD